MPRNETGAVTSRRVLIVDDNVDSAESLRMVVTLAGHEVGVAFNGKDAIAAALRTLPHAVMLDLGLPDIDSYAVAREIRSHEALRGVVIVATTGSNRAEDIEKARNAGIDEHMTKPLDLDRLLAIIDEAR